MLPRSFALALGLLLPACEGAQVGTVGTDLSDFFLTRPDWYWKYDNAGQDVVSYWITAGDTQPEGAPEPFWTVRVWVQPDQQAVEDFADEDGPSVWNAELYWARRDDGWYWMGWGANPAGPEPELGTEIFGSGGVPFALGDVRNGQSWAASVNERDFTVTATPLTEALPVHSQSVEGAWRMGLSSDAGDTPLEGTHWLALGPGLVQWDTAAWRPDGGEPWLHVTNDDVANILGNAR